MTTKQALRAGIVLFFAVQLYLTLFGGFFWPFSSHRLFSQLPQQAKWIVQARVTDSRNVTQYVHPGRVLPLEYSRCSGLIRNVFTSKQYWHPPTVRDYILHRINGEPWSVFDEMFPMIQSAPRTIFTDVSFEEHLIKFENTAAYVLQVRNLSLSHERNSPQPLTDLNHKLAYVAATLLATSIAYHTDILVPWIEGQSAAIVKPLRIWLGVAVLIMATFGPHEFYLDTHDFLYNCLMPNLGWFFEPLRMALIVTAWTTIIRPSAHASYIFAALLTRYMYHTVCFSTTYWITNTHLIWLAWMLCLPQRHNKYVVAWATAYFSVMYFQAGLSKLLLGGLEWFSTGSRIWTETILLGTPLGKYLAQWPALFVPMGWATGIFELLLSPLLLFDRTKWYAACAAFAFHLGTFSVMGISFWFAWIFYPTLYF